MNPVLQFLAKLFIVPEVNPVNKKARSIPALNPFNVYGRVFTFAWFGFMIAFWSWYAFPPLLSDVIAADIGINTATAKGKAQISNSNIISLIATLLVRLVAGPCCDRFGPRRTFAGCLLIGAIPSFCAGGITGVKGLYAVRFFIGILGGSFVPCQVWTTGFFDKNTVGFANALTAGFGNAGGGITYFVMPAIFNSLVNNQHMTRHTAWRVSFVVPGILIVATAIAMLILCPDTPTGKWSDRQLAVDESMRRHSMVGVVAVPGALSAEKEKTQDNSSPDASVNGDKKDVMPPQHEVQFGDHEAHLTPEQMYETAKGEVIRKPTIKEIAHVFFSPQTFVCAAAYFCSFGAELSINSILGTYYRVNFPGLSLQDAGNWAAMFGLLNVVFRPLGGLVSDIAYRKTGGNVWAKKILLHVFAFITGAFLIIIGKVNPHSTGYLKNNLNNHSAMFGLIAGMAFFLEAGNGLNFSLVPHVHPFANGVISGFTGASGNLGGIIFAIVFRFSGLIHVPNTKAAVQDYGRALWIIGTITIALNAAVAWIRPIPKGQISH